MIRKIISQLQDFFGISRKEARGALVLIILMSFLIWTPFVFRRLILPHFSVPVTEKKLNTQKLDSIVAELNKEAPEKPGFNNYEKKEFSKKAEKPIRLFPFDPNTASVDDLTTLGIPEFLAKRIENIEVKEENSERRKIYCTSTIFLQAPIKVWNPTLHFPLARFLSIQKNPFLPLIESSQMFRQEVITMSNLHWYLSILTPPIQHSLSN